MTKNYPKINPRHLCLPFRSFSEGGLPRYLAIAATLLLILLATHTSNLPLDPSLGASAKWEALAKWGLTTQAYAATYYIAPDACEPYHTDCNPSLGIDTNQNDYGQSPQKPWKTFEWAFNSKDNQTFRVKAGDTLILLNGTYRQTINPRSGSNGEPGNPTTIKALHDGQAIIDGQNTRTPIAINHWNGNNYLVIEGIIAANSSHHAIEIHGSNQHTKKSLSLQCTRYRQSAPDRNRPVC